ncbi:hypothetical protein LVY72_23430 [Arthrobacter sp. I2-34]|uniref:Uncharacterized protein n=1 Tax=Arthrobacter hankyongi TaxID=2904801 RepID=A0ABS9LE48_9MICC|nr:hypothetical protein [Arthrobacter hankyongi]MCG2624846.1 hypothetical protein [Arthrobacter hankyongi]
MASSSIYSGSSGREEGAHPWWAVALGVVGLLLHGGSALLYVSASLIAPLYGVFVLQLVWIILLVAGLHLMRRSPPLTLIVPAASLAALVVLAWFGGTFLGWGPAMHG